MTRWRLLPPEEYPKPLARLVKLAKRVLEDDDLSEWMRSHAANLECYLEFIDALDEVAIQPFYEFYGGGDPGETG